MSVYRLPDHPSKTQSVIWLLAMMSRSHGIYAHYAMRRLDIDRRTLRRYLAELRGSGLTVDGDGRGETRRFRVRGASLTLGDAVECGT